MVAGRQGHRRDRQQRVGVERTGGNRRRCFRHRTRAADTAVAADRRRRLARRWQRPARERAGVGG